MLKLPLYTRVLHEHRRGILGWTLGIIVLVVIQLAVYPTIRSSAAGWSTLTDQFPDAIKKIFRMDDYASERGYLTTELLSFTLPFIVMGLGCTWGARIATEDEEAGTADILLTLPLSRTDYVTTRLLAAVSVLIFAVTCFFLTLVLGTRLLGLSIPIHKYYSAAFSLFSIGILMLVIASSIGALTGKRTSALGISMATAIALFVLYSLGPLVRAIDRTTRFNPMQWTIGSRPLFNGTSFGYTVCVIALAMPFVFATYLFFARRDIGN